MICKLCGGNMILDQKRFELYCERCGFVNDNLPDVLEATYTGIAMHKKIKHYERNRRYHRRRAREKMIKKFDTICKKYQVEISFDIFLLYWNSKGMPNNIISRDMEKLLKKFIFEADTKELFSNL